MVGMGCENDPLKLRSAQQRGDRSVAKGDSQLRAGENTNAIARAVRSTGSQLAEARRRDDARAESFPQANTVGQGPRRG